MENDNDPAWRILRKIVESGALTDLSLLNEATRVVYGQHGIRGSCDLIDTSKDTQCHSANNVVLEMLSLSGIICVK